MINVRSNTPLMYRVSRDLAQLWYLAILLLVGITRVLSPFLPKILNYYMVVFSYLMNPLRCCYMTDVRFNTHDGRMVVYGTYIYINIYICSRST